MHLFQRQLLTTSALLAAAGLAAAQSFEVYQHEGTVNDQAGYAVAGLGDVDGDGVEDYGMGSPTDAVFGVAAGKAVIYSGKTGGVIRTHSGEADGDRFGWSLAGLGDVDGDGCDDYIIGAPLWDSIFPNCGKVYVVSGKTGDWITTNYWPESGAQSGYAVCGPGDVNGDGVPDYVFSVPWYDELSPNLPNCGRVFLVSGSSFATLWTHSGSQSGGVLGYSLDKAGDMNGDGSSEIVVGAPFEDFGLNNNGRGHVLNGSTGATLFTRHGWWNSGLLGHDVAGVGDVDGDGIPDVGFGSPWAASNGPDCGVAMIFSGNPPYPQIQEISGAAGVRAGYSLAGIGDADGDGRDDYAVGMPWGNVFGLTNAGWVQLISGASGTPFEILLGESTGEFLGYSAAGLGDLNHDGYADVITGAPSDDSHGNNSGKARVFLSHVSYPKIYCTTKVNSGGCTPSIDSSGTPSASIANDFHVSASDILFNVPGILIWSQTSASTPFGGGTLCLAAPVRRTPGQNSGGTPGQPCSGRFDLHLSHAFMASQGIVPGMVVHAQYWSRDAGFAAPNNVNLTNAVRFTLAP